MAGSNASPLVPLPDRRGAQSKRGTALAEASDTSCSLQHACTSGWADLVVSANLASVPRVSKLRSERPIHPLGSPVCPAGHCPDCTASEPIDLVALRTVPECV